MHTAGWRVTKRYDLADWLTDLAGRKEILKTELIHFQIKVHLQDELQQQAILAPLQPLRKPQSRQVQDDQLWDGHLCLRQVPGSRHHQELQGLPGSLQEGDGPRQRTGGGLGRLRANQRPDQ